MKALPRGWSWSNLGDLCEKPDYGWTTKAARKGSVRFLRTTDISAPSIDWDAVPFCHEAPDAGRRYRIAPGDIVISRAGSVGLSKLIHACPDAVFASYLIRFRPRGRVLPKYLAYFLQSPAYWMEIAAKAAGIALQNVNAKKLAAIPVPVAPLDEQARMVAEIEKQLTRLDAGVQALKRLQAHLRRYQAAVLRAAVSGRLIPSDPTAAPSQSSSSFAHPPWPVPPGWTWTTVDRVGDVLLGRQRAPQYLTGRHSQPYLRVANIGDDRVDLTDLNEMDFDPNHLAKYRLQVGDILVSEGQSPERLGQSAIYRGGVKDLCFQKTLHRWRAVPGGPSPEFAQLVFRAHVRTGVFRSLGSITTNIGHLTLEKFKAAPFPLPPETEVDLIVAEAQRLLSVADAADEAVAAQLARSKRLRASILRAAFDGRLTAPEQNSRAPAA